MEGEVTCLSLMGVKGLTSVSIFPLLLFSIHFLTCLQGNLLNNQAVVDPDLEHGGRGLVLILQVFLPSAIPFFLPEKRGSSIKSFFN